MFEVEQKFQVDAANNLLARVAALGGEFGPPANQIDNYYAHPSRDFAQTDEALRIRRVDDEAYVTYKGAKIDQVTKTRRELELPLAGGPEGAERFAELLEVLGFRPVVTVVKQRRHAIVRWCDRDVEVALDDVAEVGLFIELELQADEGDVPLARDCLASLANELGVARNERRSYLELLLAARGRRLP
jgi:adenylate cyclase, class 2